jgi:hypothetical protein
MQQDALLNNPVARAAAVEAGKKQLEIASQAYDQAYLQNLTEMEFGPSCHCNRYPWQHELHPSGMVKRVREQGERREDEKIGDREGVDA